MWPLPGTFAEWGLAHDHRTRNGVLTRVRGYDPAAVDAYVEALLAKQKLLIDEVQNLRAQRNESGDQLAALRIEVACLKDEVAHLSDTSPTPYAIQHRMTKMLRRTLEEISRMQAEAQAEAESMIAAAAAQVEASHREHQELLADMAAQREALGTEREEAKKELRGRTRDDACGGPSVDRRGAPGS